MKVDSQIYYMGGKAVDMKDLKVSVKHENLDDLKELLQKATDQVEQLQETLQAVENFKPSLNVDLKP